MSAKYFTTYIQPKDDRGRDNVLNLIALIKAKDWGGIIDKHGEYSNLLVGNSPLPIEDRDSLEKNIKHYMGMDIRWKENNGVFELVYDTPTSFDEEKFSKFLLYLGVEDTESVYDDSGCGEYGFVKNGKYYSNYHDCVWKWIQEPILLEEKYVVFTGKLTKGTREEMTSYAEDAGAIVQKEVNKKTNYLVIGDDVGEKKLSKAKELGVKIITEKEFLIAVGEDS